MLIRVYTKGKTHKLYMSRTVFLVVLFAGLGSFAGIATKWVIVVGDLLL